MKFVKVLGELNPDAKPRDNHILINVDEHPISKIWIRDCGDWRCGQGVTIEFCEGLSGGLSGAWAYTYADSFEEAKQYIDQLLEDLQNREIMVVRPGIVNAITGEVWPRCIEK